MNKIILKTINNIKRKKNMYKNKIKTIHSVKKKLILLSKLQKLKDEIKKKKEIKRNVIKYQNCKKFVNILKEKVKEKKEKTLEKLKINTYNKILNHYNKKSKTSLYKTNSNKISIIDFIKIESHSLKIPKLVLHSLKDLNMNELKKMINNNSRLRIKNIKRKIRDIDSPNLKKRKNEIIMKRKKKKKILFSENKGNNIKPYFFKKRNNNIELKYLYEAKIDFDNQLNIIKNKINNNKKILFKIKRIKSNKITISNNINKKSFKNIKKINSNSDSDSNLIPFEENLTKNYNKVLKLKNKKSFSVGSKNDKLLKLIKSNIDKCNKNFLYKNE